MDTEMPPKYSEPASEAKGTLRFPMKGGSWLFGLIFYAGAITAGLIVVSVLGAMYLNDVKSTCSQVDKGDGLSADQWKKYKNYTVKQPDNQRADTSLNTEANKEIVRIRDGEEETIMVFDFTKSVVGIWSPATNECYLIGGIDQNIPDARKTESILESLGLDDKESVDSGDDSLEYSIAKDYSVTNLDLLPKELHSHCWGKKVFWVEKNNAQDAGGVQKRQTRCCPLRCYVYIIGCSRTQCYYRRICLCYKCGK